MASNGGAVTVMYKVVNSETDPCSDLYNAFQMPRTGGGVTLATIKQHCPALNHLNHIGANGFHWRVCIEDKQVAGIKAPMFSWWDIQDENARLPVKEFGLSQIQSMFMPGSSGGSSSSSSSDAATKAAKGALKGFGKAMNAMASAVEGSHVEQGPRVPIIAFKLLDLVKMHDDFALKHGGSKGHAPVVAPRAAAPKPRAPQQQQRQPAHRTPPTRQQPAQPTPQQQRRPQQQQRPTPARPAPPPPNLMDFGASAPAANGGGFDRSTSIPSSKETRAEKLKREYAKKNQNANRVWDDVDQRWVEVDPKAGVKGGSHSAPQEERVSNAKKIVGVKLDGSSAAGKSADVQAAVHGRINEMRESQAKAVSEIRAREEKKKMEDAAEDEVRKRLEPKIKVWAEEHGTKKQLRALLASLHTILWAGANWKSMGIGDLLDDGKVKRAFFKASRVVHPDKTHDLDAEKRFLAKRIFDALSQAKTVFDDGK